MIDHLSLECDDVARSIAFYDAVLAPLGGRRVMDFGTVVAYGTDMPIFWVRQANAKPANREIHLAFQAADREAVRSFRDAAVAAGAEVLHEPRVWPEYHEHYFGAFVRDPDGHNVEAVCHRPE